MGDQDGQGRGDDELGRDVAQDGTAHDKKHAEPVEMGTDDHGRTKPASAGSAAGL